MLAMKGVGGLSESIKKEKFVTKNLFLDDVKWSSRNLWKKDISADVTATKNSKK